MNEFYTENRCVDIMAGGIPDQTYKKVNFSDTRTAYAAYSIEKLKKSYLLLNLLKSRFLSSLGLKVAKRSIQFRLPVNSLVKNAYFMLFCGGEDLVECESVINELGNCNIGTILDYATEGVVKDEDFDRVMDEVINSIDFAAAGVLSSMAHTTSPACLNINSANKTLPNPSFSF